MLITRRDFILSPAVVGAYAGVARADVINVRHRQTLTATGWSGFTYSRSLTFDGTKVPNSSQADFPVLLTLTDATLKNGGGHVYSPGGYDICFFADPGLTNRLCVERESYNPSTGAWMGWVKAPTLYSGSDTTIYVAYGNADMSADPNLDGVYGAAKVWTNGYLAVVHGGSPTSLSWTDSVAGLAPAVVGAYAAGSGEIGGAISAPGGVSAGASYGNAAKFTASRFSVAAWLKWDGSSGSWRCPFSKGNYSSGEWAVLYNTDNGQPINFYIQGGAKVSVTNPHNTAWNRLVVSYDQNKATIFLNGAQAAQATPGAITISQSASAFEIGGQNNGSYPWGGLLDEIHYSNTARTADWFAAEFNNQSSPGNVGSPGFLKAVGAEVVL